jgi:hypothetical protein
MKPVDVFKETDDEWYPSFNLENETQLVRVSFTQTTSSKKWRVCAWGNDDCGLEADFDNETVAWNTFLQVILSEKVNMDMLISMGFVSA